jgi:hypothetical protein
MITIRQSGQGVKQPSPHLLLQFICLFNIHLQNILMYPDPADPVLPYLLMFGSKNSSALLQISALYQPIEKRNSIQPFIDNTLSSFPFYPSIYLGLIKIITGDRQSISVFVLNGFHRKAFPEQLNYSAFLPLINISSIAYPYSFPYHALSLLIHSEHPPVIIRRYYPVISYH